MHDIKVFIARAKAVTLASLFMMSSNDLRVSSNSKKNIFLSAYNLRHTVNLELNEARKYRL